MSRIIIMTKAPIVGNVKTRLMKTLSADETTQLHTRMIETTIRKALMACENVWLATDDPTESSIRRFSDMFDVTIHKQVDGQLGERLSALMEKSYDLSDDFLLFLGSDSPHVSPERYKQAFAALGDNHDIVIGPVEDGGYDLIAIKRNIPEIFLNISWGSDIVLQQTLNHCERLQLRVKLLEISFDIDHPEDLERAPVHTW